MIPWRAIIAAAIADGARAEKAIGERDLACLLALPAGRRRSILDGGIVDSRLANLNPGQKAQLRESIRPGAPDPEKQAAAVTARLQHKLAVLAEYVAAYDSQLQIGRRELPLVFDRVFQDGFEVADRALIDLRISPPGQVYRAVFGEEYGRLCWWPRASALNEAREAVKRMSELARMRQAALAEIATIRMGATHHHEQVRRSHT